MRALLSPGFESAGSCCGPEAPPEARQKPCACESSCLSVSLWNHAGFSVQRVCGDPANASVWVLAGFREEMPDGTGRLQSNLDSGGYLWKVKGQVLLSCPTLCDPLDFRIHGILQAKILEWAAFPFSRGSSKPRGRTQVSACRQILCQLSHREAQDNWTG